MSMLDDLMHGDASAEDFARMVFERTTPSLKALEDETRIRGVVMCLEGVADFARFDYEAGAERAARGAALCEFADGLRWLRLEQWLDLDRWADDGGRS